EVDELAEFTDTTPKGLPKDLDLSKFMEADPENDAEVESDEDINAILNGDSDSEDDEDEADSEDAEGEDAEMEDEDDDEDDEEAVFKKQLEAMMEKDTSFAKYMKKNDPESLKILDAMPKCLQMRSKEQEDQEQEEPAAATVTLKMLHGWENAVTNQHSLKSLKRLLLAFYSASHMDAEDEDSDDVPFRIEGMRVFNKVVSTSLRVAPKAFARYAPVVDGKVTKKAGSKWSTIQALVKSYLASLLELMKQMSDAAMIQYLIKESEKALPYFVCFARFTRDLLKELLRQFGSTTADDGVRILALMTLRKLVSMAPAEVTDMALKGIYLTHVRHSNVKNITSLTTIQLMRNCGVELYGVDANASYQHAFVYIRQLAIHLRNSMQLRSKESFRAIYNWQFVNSLHFWTEVLATYCGDRADEQPQLCETLESLVYPLTQIIMGVARLVPTAKYFPLRLHCVRMLLRISSSTGIFIPVLPMLVEVLESSEFLARRPLKSTLKPLTLDSYLKAPKEYEHTRVYLDSILESVFELLADAIAAQSTRIAFPEWVVPAALQLRRWRKRVGKSWMRFSKQLQGLLEKTEQTAKMVQQHRAKVDFSPANLSAANRFMEDVHPDTTPIGAYAVSLRKVRAQQRATLLEAEADE
ncbi:Noc2-domain-containing protein, partial [Linderina pennispora]